MNNPVYTYTPNETKLERFWTMEPQKTLINKITIPSKLVIYAKIKFVGELRLNTQ